MTDGSPALVLLGHVGMDRALGYGLKRPTGFGDTHLGRIGRERDPIEPGPAGLRDLVGEAGFEPAASCSQSTRAAKLRHSPTIHAWVTHMLLAMST